MALFSLVRSKAVSPDTMGLYWLYPVAACFSVADPFFDPISAGGAAIEDNLSISSGHAYHNYEKMCINDFLIKYFLDK
jgi:hypothetical protein